MKQPLTIFEFFLVIGLMMFGSNLLQHPLSTNESQLGWAMLLVPAAWFNMQLLSRRLCKQR